MTLEEFAATFSSASPPGGLPPALVALWHDGKGDWHTAHEAVQALADPDGARIHAYLHRKEGDASNAAYWYRRAGQPVAAGPLQPEWERLVLAFLTRDTS